MTRATGNDDPRVVSTINEAIDLDANGDTLGAVQLLTDLLPEFPNAAGVHGYLAWFLSELGRCNEAIEQSQQAINLAPKSEKASLVHFFALWEGGKQIEALDEMKRFLTIRPSEEYANIIQEWEPDVGARGGEE